MVPGGSKRKGGDFEREVVRHLVSLGVDAKKMPLSGALGGEYGGDIKLVIRRNGDWLGDERAECKIRKRAWADIYSWLAGNYCLFIRREKSETLVVMRLADFARLIK